MHAQAGISLCVDVTHKEKSSLKPERGPGACDVKVKVVWRCGVVVIDRSKGSVELARSRKVGRKSRMRRERRRGRRRRRKMQRRMRRWRWKRRRRMRMRMRMRRKRRKRRMRIV
jgi:hypothetical protein